MDSAKFLIRQQGFRLPDQVFDKREILREEPKESEEI